MFNNVSEEVISIKKYVCVMQDSAKDCGVCCLLSIVQYYGGNIPKEMLRVMTNTTRDGVNSYSLLNVGRELGFDTKGVNGSVFDIGSLARRQLDLYRLGSVPWCTAAHRKIPVEEYSGEDPQGHDPSLAAADLQLRPVF